MSSSPDRSSHPPETLEGWYSLHQLFTIDRSALRALRAGHDATLVDSRRALETLTAPREKGWTAIVPLIGSRADVMFVHMRETLDALGDAQRELSHLHLADALRPTYSFLSVTEAGMYHLTAKLAKDAADRGGQVGDERHQTMLAERLDAERASEMVQRRLYPPLPSDMEWVCFYPMSKKREAGQNWYTLPLEERSRLMWEHGLSGRRYAGRIIQIVSGAIGLDAWEWGVTLFGRDPLDFKKIVSDLRFDEASAKYGEFGEFFVGKRQTPADWLATL